MALVLCVVATVAVVGAVGTRVHALLHPERVDADFSTIRDALARFDEVAFRSTDGIDLSGWWLDGRDDLPAIVLCHDRGSSKAAHTSLALTLAERGFPVLLFDFRGHGGSGGSTSGLGILEAHDVIGAVDFVTRERPDGAGGAHAAVYGVGMGAHAAVLAAAERPTVAAVVLDGLYPDVTWPLARGTFGSWEFGERHLAFLPEMVFSAMARQSASERRAEDAIPRLAGKDVLMLAPQNDARLADAMERMVRTIPETRDGDGSLVVMPATGTSALYGEALAHYERDVADFLEQRLAATTLAEGVATAGPGPRPRSRS